jgi:hypothetical protein
MLISKDMNTINGIATTNAKALEDNINHYVRQWRDKWSFESEMRDGYQDKDLFKVHVLAGSVDTVGNDQCSRQSVEAMIKRNRGDGKVFLDDTKDLHRKYGFGWSRAPGGIVVVRPDSHIGYRVIGAGEAAWKDVDEYFSSILAL